MKNLIYILTTLLLFSFIGKDLKLVADIEVTNPTVFTDHLDNIYIVENQEITKYNSKGELKFKQSNKLIGDLKFVDSSNPLKLLLFYPDIGQISYLDNMLSETSDIFNLYELGLEQATLACNSYNSGFWVYDQQRFEIIRINMEGKETYKSTNLNQLIENASPNYLLEYDNRVYLNIPAAGILVFDLYGTYISKIDIKDLQKFQILNNKLYYSNQNKFYNYDFKSKEINETPIPDTHFMDINLSPNVLAVSHSNGVKIYSTKRK